MLKELFEDKDYQALQTEIEKLNSEKTLLTVKGFALRYIKNIAKLDSLIIETENDHISPISKSDKNEFIHEWTHESFVYRRCLLICIEFLENKKTLDECIREQEENIQESSLVNVNPNACGLQAIKEEEIELRIYKDFRTKLKSVQYELSDRFLSTDEMLRGLRDKAKEEHESGEQELNSIQEEANKEIAKFTPSTIEEIKSYKIKEDEKYEIELITTCPFTNISSVDSRTAIVEDMAFQGSIFDMCFVYTGDGGEDSYAIFENTKIIKKYDR